MGKEMGLITPAKDHINSRRASRKHVYLRFPSNLGAHAIVLNFKEYSYDATKTGINSINPKASIVLPLPSNLADTYTVNANGRNLGIGGSLVGAALGASKNWNADSAVNAVISGGVKAVGEAANLFSDNGRIPELGSNFAAYAKFLSRSAVDGLLPGAGMGIDLATGTAINPHTSVDFDGVNLKAHNFSWTFSPKDESESMKLVEIQNAIRRAILPAYQGLGVTGGIAPLERALLKYPNLVDIFFVGVDQSYLYYFKPAMVTQFEMNFTGNGQAPAILKGGKPAFVQMNLHLLETQIHTSEDYGGAYGGNLGSNPTPSSYGVNFGGV